MPSGKSSTPQPTFLFIGGDRCGSKSLHNMFRQHPECYVPPIADPYFFDKNYERGLPWYLGLFANAPVGVKAIGELSHDYLHSRQAAERIRQHLPDVKILVTLRHPVDRSFSSYAAAHSAGVIGTSFQLAIREVPMLIENSLYADRLQVYFDLFPREQIKVLFFEELENDPQRFGEEAFAFVGLPPVDGIDFGRKMSQLSQSRLPYSGMISKQVANLCRRLGWVNLLGWAKSNKFVRSLFYKPYAAGEKPEADSESKIMLQEIFSPQIDRLEVMLQCNLSHWRR
ncbi:MAG TPA: sulfotransferase [Planctomycetaceae bacterium]|nr:sulfotransferase [Planctomycetaceae bacterium]HQZ63456.1 sulfotransferase [Planctomycetaceae bacterium]